MHLIVQKYRIFFFTRSDPDSNISRFSDPDPHFFNVRIRNPRDKAEIRFMWDEFQIKRGEIFQVYISGPAKF